MKDNHQVEYLEPLFLLTVQSLTVLSEWPGASTYRVHVSNRSHCDCTESGTANLAVSARPYDNDPQQVPPNVGNHAHTSPRRVYVVTGWAL
jgi:hypothetical protein